MIASLKKMFLDYQEHGFLSDHPSRGLWVFFLGSALFWFLCQVYPIIAVDSRRLLPPEVDDSYAYILKAEQLLNCLGRDCPALEDILVQIDSQPENYTLKRLYHSHYKRLFVFYAPLHSSLLAALKSISGFSWEKTYALSRVLIIFLLCLALALFQSRFLGLGPAALSFLLMSTTIFNQTIIPVPSTLALVPAILSWYFSSFKGRSVPILVLVCYFTSLYFHPIGLATAAFSLFFFIILYRPLFSRAKLIVSGIIILFSAFYYLRPDLISILPWGLAPDPIPDGWTWLIGLKANLDLALVDLKRFSLSFLGFEESWLAFSPLAIRPFISVFIPLLFLFLVILGLIRAIKERGWPILVSAAAIMILLLSSVGYVRVFPGNIFNRVWFVIAYYFSGLACFFVVSGLRRAYLRVGLISWPKIKEVKAILLPALFYPALLVLLISAGFRQIDNYKGWIDFVVIRHNWNFDPRQPELLFSLAKPGDKILYHGFGKHILYYFLSHGGLSHRTVFPDFAQTKDEYEAMVNQAGVKFYVLKNPVTILVASERGNVDLHEGVRIDLSREGFNPTDLRLVVKNDTDHPLKLQTSWFWGKKMDHGYSIPGGATVEIEPGNDSLATGGGKSLKWIDLKGGERNLKLVGFRLHPQQKSRWPWKTKARITGLGRDAQGRVNLGFQPEELLPELKRKVTFLDDEGSVVIFRSNN